MRNAPYPAGVPTPYSLHVHPYPTRFHGPNYTRPVFGFPQIARTQQVFTPGYDLSRGAVQPPISGLGATVGEGMLWDAGDGIFKPGGYGGGVFDNNISGLGSLGTVAAPRKRAQRGGLRGLGDDSADYPWRVETDKTRALQKATNESLAKAGLCTLTVDGKLGGATCGARNYLTANSEKLFGQEMLFSNPSACAAHPGDLVRPQTKASGCGASGPGLTVVPSSSAPLPASTFESGMSSSTKRTLGFALGGLLALGAVVMLRRKH